jgi:hypothetical protein
VIVQHFPGRVVIVTPVDVVLDIPPITIGVDVSSRVGSSIDNILLDHLCNRLKRGLPVF